MLLYQLSGGDEYYDLPQRLRLHRENMRRLKQLQPRIDHLLPNHNGFPIDSDYIDRFISLVDAVLSGEAIIEDKLNHRFIEMDPIAPKLCRVKYNDASFFAEKDKLLAVYGKGDI